MKETSLLNLIADKVFAFFNKMFETHPVRLVLNATWILDEDAKLEFRKTKKRLFDNVN